MTFNDINKYLSGNDSPDPMLEVLYNIEYTWSKDIPLDENRAADAIYYVSQDETRKPSVLEVLLALAIKANELSGHELGLDDVDFFWIFVRNLGIDDLEISAKDIGKRAVSWMDRDGKCDIFDNITMKNYHKSNKYWKKTQLWMQLNYYLEELSKNRVGIGLL